VKEIVAVGGVVSSSSTVNTIGNGFSSPTGVAVDGSGNVFVADNGNNAVKEIVAVGGVVSSSSTVNTIGNGFSFPYAVAVDGSGNVFVADNGNSAVKEIVAVGGVVSSSSTVKTIGNGFNLPFGVAVDGSGNVFVGDLGNSAVKEIVAVGGVVSSSSTVNTIGSGFRGPDGVAVDGSGNVFVADNGNNAVKEIMAVGGVVSSSSTVNTIGSGFMAPVGVAVDGSGNVFVGDTVNNAVKEIDLSDPPSLSFPKATNVGSTDSTDGVLTVTVANSGNAVLSFPDPDSGGNPSIAANFALGSSTTCPMLINTSTTDTTLAAGASCTLAVDFEPTTAGSISGSLVISDNNLNGNPATQTISLSGTGIAVPTATTAIASTILTLNHAAVAFTPVTGSGGTGTLSYSVSPLLPAGLSFNASTGAISGTPTAISGAVSYTVTVTDSNSATATASFSLTVAVVAATQAVASESLTQNHTAVAFTPVIGSGGTGTLSYSVSPSLPAGLSFNASTGAISGTPTVISGAVSYTVTVTDSNNATATASFSLTVNAAVAATQAVASESLTQNHATVAFTPVTGSGGTGTLSYSVFPAVPAGLSFNTSTGAISGTPTATSAAANYTVTVTDSSSATATAIFSLTVNAAVTPVLSWSTPAAVIYGTALSATQLNATASYNGSAVPGSFTYTPALGTVLNAGTHTLAVTFTPTDTTNYGTPQTATNSITVTQAGSTTTLTASSSSLTPGQSLTLTAQVGSATTGTPTGTVSFYAGATLLGTSTLSSGAASYTTSTLAAGVSYALTASYQGDTNFMPYSNSFAVSVQVAALDFGMTTGTQSQTVIPGAATTFTFQISPSYGVYPTQVNFTAAGLPPGATATFSPASLAANSGAQTITLTVQTAAVTARSREGHTPWSLALLLLPLAGARRLRRSSQRLQKLLLAAVFLFAGVALAGLSGCGGGGNVSVPQQPQNYTITVTAASGAVQHTSTVTLNVQ
jgi:sugar lactone lactonase YvrE